MNVVPFGVVDVVVETARLLALHGATHNEFCHGSDISELYKIRCDYEIPVIVFDLFLNQPYSP